MIRMDEAVKEINEIIPVTKRRRGRPKEYVKCKSCKAWTKKGQEHNCQINNTNNTRQEAVA